MKIRSISIGVGAWGKTYSGEVSYIDGERSATISLTEDECRNMLDSLKYYMPKAEVDIYGVDRDTVLLPPPVKENEDGTP